MKNKYKFGVFIEAKTSKFEHKNKMNVKKMENNEVVEMEI
ncbi:hypothetical protein BVRB_8g181560 [Beta vulgaris subsp. vulgaris]|nr:hypothetical protein BVRB_8g181560 [Beta vulgaris subsp. vulgaris]